MSNIVVYVVQPCGKVKTLHIPNTLDGIYNTIGCNNLEYVPLDSTVFKGLHAYVDGIGLYKQLPINNILQNHNHGGYFGNILFSRVDVVTGDETGVSAMDMHLLDKILFWETH